MAVMTIVDVCMIVYPGEIEAGNISFGMDVNNRIFINNWAVKNLPQPIENDLESQITVYQPTWEITNFIATGIFSLNYLADSVANQRGYNSALMCMSYKDSSNVAWSADAIQIGVWRDSIFAYFVKQVALMRSAARTVPTFDEFQSELPLIQWPLTTNFPESQPT